MLNFFINESKESLTVYQVLFKVPGIGNKKSLFICKQIGLIPSTKWHKITESQVKTLAVWIDETFFGKNVVGPEFKKKEKENILFKRSIKSYHGIRRKIGLPIRGQNTHSNAKTAKRFNFWVSV